MESVPRMQQNRGERSSLVGVFLPVGVAFAIAAFCLTALVWDGSGYLFNALQDGSPRISHHRYSNYPVLWVMVEASRWIQEPRALAVIYGLLLAITPIGALAICFYYLRGGLARLRLWPVLGILVAALPGQICVMSEATLVVQAFWPVLAILAAGLPGRGMVWLAALTPYLFFLHPLSAPLFGLAAVVAGWFGWSSGRKREWAWSGIFLLMVGGRVMFSVVTATPYERGEFALQPNIDAAMGSLHGWPSVMLAALFVMAWASLGTSFGLLPEKRGRQWFHWAAVGLAAAGCLWAVSPDLWAGALGYRRFVLLFSLPLFAGAMLNWWGLEQSSVRGSVGGGMWPAVAFSLVLTVQAVTWRVGLEEFADGLRSAPGRVVSKVDVPWIDQRPLDHWGTSFIAIFLQGRDPEKIFSLSADAVSGDAILLYPDEWLIGNDGWFRLVRE